MFEQYKLNKYKDCMKGFAYETIYKEYSVDIQIYLVVEKDEKNEFIKYRKIRKILSYERRDVIKELEANGYKSLSYYVSGKDKCKVYKISNVKRMK